MYNNFVTIQINRKKQNGIWLEKMIKEGWLEKLQANIIYQKTIAKYQKNPPNNPRKKALYILKELSLK